tara:strand:- start:242 stop:1201 length:960 start_codon:yes stop_codon:yes gene_type:complete
MVSIIIVNYMGNKFVNFLVKNLEKTMRTPEPWEIIVVENSESDADKKNCTFYYRKCKGKDLTEEISEPPEYREHPNVKVVSNSYHSPDGSVHHASGLNLGWKHTDSRTQKVMVMDQDLIFLEDGWDVPLLDKIDGDIVMVGGISWVPHKMRNKRYSSVFLKAPFLVLNKAFFDPLVEKGYGFMPYFSRSNIDKEFPLYPALEYQYKSYTGDTACRLTWWREILGKKKILLRNSDNYQIEQLFSANGSGFTAYGFEGQPIIHHLGSSYEALWGKSGSDVVRKIYDRGYLVPEDLVGQRVFYNDMKHHRFEDEYKKATRRK